jgi:hypothetical protein
MESVGELYNPWSQSVSYTIHAVGRSVSQSVSYTIHGVSQSVSQLYNLWNRLVTNTILRMITATVNSKLWLSAQENLNPTREHSARDSSRCGQEYWSCLSNLYVSYILRGQYYLGTFISCMMPTWTAYRKIFPIPDTARNMHTDRQLSGIKPICINTYFFYKFRYIQS